MITRILTALLLAPVVIAITLFAPSTGFMLMLLLIVALGLIEWCRMVELPALQVTLLAGLLVIVVVVLTLSQIDWLIWVAVLAALYWVSQLVDMWRNQLGVRRSATVSIAEGLLVLSAACLSLIILHREAAQGPLLALTLLMLVWAADSCAYFCGKRFGKNKLAPEISPGQTIEGLIGGLGGALLVAVGMSYVFEFVGWQLAAWLLASAAAALFSVVGDLNESRLKRWAGVKDSGSLLPGHGGVLDRIDGLIAAAPVFVAVLAGSGVLQR